MRRKGTIIASVSVVLLFAAYFLFQKTVTHPENPPQIIESDELPDIDRASDNHDQEDEPPTISSAEQSVAVTDTDVSPTIQILTKPDFDPLERLNQNGVETSYDNLLAVLGDSTSDPSLRNTAALAIGQSARPSAYDALVAAYGDPSLEVKLGVLRGLMLINNSQSAEFFKQVLITEENAVLREDAMLGLSANPTSDATEALVRAMEFPNQSKSTRSTLLGLLAHRNGAQVDDALRTLMNDSDPELQAYATIELSKRYGEIHTPDIVNAPLNPDLPNHAWADLVNQLQDESGQDFSGGVIRASFDMSRREALNEAIQDWFATRNDI